jgi:hypothetical protein
MNSGRRRRGFLAAKAMSTWFWLVGGGLIKDILTQDFQLKKLRVCSIY